MARSLLRAVLLALPAAAAAACAAPPTPGGWADPPAEVTERVRAAEALLASEDALGAVAAAREAVALAPRHPDGHRILQAARTAAGEDRAVRREAEAAVAADPGDPLARLLLARTEHEPRRAAALLEEALAKDPDLLWARLGLALLAVSRGDDHGAAEALAAAAVSAPDHPAVTLVAAQAASARRRSPLALDLLREAVRRDPRSLRARESLGRRLLAVPGGGSEAREQCAAAFALAPGSRSAAGAWREALDEGASPDELAAAVAAVDALPDPHPAARHLRGAARARLGPAADALPDLRAALAAGEDRTAVLDDLRWACVAADRLPEFLAAEAAATPPGLLDDPLSATGTLRADLAAAAAAAAADPADAAAGARLTDLCRRAGWLREAALLAARRAAALPDDPTARADVEECARTLAFLAEFRAAWKGDYHGHAGGGEGGDLDGALAALAALSRRHLGVDLAAGLARRSFPFLGEMAESVRAEGPAAEWFRAHGLALLLGSPSGEPVEARLLRVVALRPPRVETLLGRPFPILEVTGEGLLVPSRREAAGAVLGGATVGDLVFLDLEGVARWSGAAVRARRDPRIRACLEAVPEETAADGDEALSLRWPGRVVERLALRVDAWDDPAAALADFLEAARRHEHAHAADAARYLPVLSRPFAGLALLIRGSFSGSGVAAVLEGDAEIAALASAPEPRASLATLLSFLPSRDGGLPHSRGYHGAAGELLAVLRERGAIPADAVAVRVLDRVDPAAIRSAAREVCRRRGLLGE